MAPDSRTSDSGDGSVVMASRHDASRVTRHSARGDARGDGEGDDDDDDGDDGGGASLHARRVSASSSRVAVVELVLRGIERGEVAAAVALIIEGTLSPGVEDLSRLDDYWAAVVQGRERGGEVFVALMDTQVVAMCQVVIFRHFQHTAGLCAELESVYVRGDLRGRGVGATLIAHAEAFAREKGCYRLQLTSRNERHDAHRFYERYGFAPVSQGFKKSLVE